MHWSSFDLCTPNLDRDAVARRPVGEFRTLSAAVGSDLGSVDQQWTSSWSQLAHPRPSLVRTYPIGKRDWCVRVAEGRQMPRNGRSVTTHCPARRCVGSPPTPHAEAGCITLTGPYR